MGLRWASFPAGRASFPGRQSVRRRLRAALLLGAGPADPRGRGVPAPLAPGAAGSEADGWQSSGRQVVRSSGRQVVRSSGRQVVRSSGRQVVRSSGRQVTACELCGSQVPQVVSSALVVICTRGMSGEQFGTKKEVRCKMFCESMLLNKWRAAECAQFSFFSFQDISTGPGPIEEHRAFR